jgi:hypothetical protein
MPRIKLTKSTIDVLPTPESDVIYWDAGYPGFGVKVTPKGRKVFLVLYRTGGAGSKLRKYTIGPYGRVTLHQARVAAQKVFAAKLEGRDPASEKREAKRKVVADGVEELLEAFITQHVSQNRSGGETSRLLRREVGKTWAGRSIHEITKRDVVEVISAIEEPSSIDPPLKASPYRRRRLLEIEFSTIRSSHKSSSRLGRWTVPMAVSLNCWPSRASAAKRSRG